MKNVAKECSNSTGYYGYLDSKPLELKEQQSISYDVHLNEHFHDFDANVTKGRQNIWKCFQQLF